MISMKETYDKYLERQLEGLGPYQTALIKTDLAMRDNKNCTKWTKEYLLKQDLKRVGLLK